MLSGGLGPRPPGTTTWLRGASLHGSGREKLPEREPRPQTQNPHGGAPKGARPASWDAGAPRKRPGPPRDTSAFTRVLCDISAFTRVLCDISAFTRVLCDISAFTRVLCDISAFTRVLCDISAFTRV